MSLEQLIRLAVDRPLSIEEAEAAFDEVMQGRATPVQIAALLVGIRARGAAPDEVAGGVRALRRAMVPVDVHDVVGVIDTCGTGGGSVTTFNISTAAALLVSGLGVKVAKHGNRSFSSRCGSADVLEALGVGLEASPQRKAEILNEIGIVFLFAPAHHPAMRHVGPIRKELGMFTIMNLLGPLTNPVRVRRQVVGVSDPALLELVARALAALGHEHALVVHGEPGLDELSPLGATRILEVRNGEIEAYDFLPDRDLGWSGFSAEDLAGGEPAENAAVIADVLQGRGKGTARAAVLLNAAAALLVADRVDSLVDGVAEAERALDGGAGWSQLERLRTATWTAAGT
ncbi:MAG TPA: anthranilate phosphoribosyltransferase [Longimicrobiaceae bacterium]|nr:anthranilate phosphoribosyltransferase [Longimicrobiaceae bacterium]